MKKKDTLFIAQAGIIAALYAALCIILAPISFSVFQVRIAEALCVLPFFTSAAIPGLTIGCLIANIFGGGNIFDVIFGTCATLIGAMGSYLLRKSKFKLSVVIPPIVANTLIIPFILKYAYEMEEGVPFMMLTVGVGEIIAVGILGSALLIVLSRTKVFAPRESK
ncbi:MAG: QueT transporter family protein [Lachnospiraceae bacterium]|nr:QueT transporter family protein [Lachnospiraceae bacterium]